jgi:hypothetical protein
MKRTRRPHIPFSDAERQWLQHNRLMVIGDYHRAFCAQFGRTDVRADDLHRLRKRMGWRVGRTGHFEKGAMPSNKGKRMPYNANSARTWFKKGQPPPNLKHAGHERINKDGYVEVSIYETNPHTGFERRYVHKHRWLWEQMHGPIPKDMVLKCKSDKANSDPSNWELVPRALLPRLNNRWGRNYDEAPAELKPTIMAVAKLETRMADRKQLNTLQRPGGDHGK